MFRTWFVATTGETRIPNGIGIEAQDRTVHDPAPTRTTTGRGQLHALRCDRRQVERMRERQNQRLVQVDLAAIDRSHLKQP